MVRASTCGSAKVVPGLKKPENAKKAVTSERLGDSGAGMQWWKRRMFRASHEDRPRIMPGFSYLNSALAERIPESMGHVLASRSRALGFRVRVLGFRF